MQGRRTGKKNGRSRKRDCESDSCRRQKHERPLLSLVSLTWLLEGKKEELLSDFNSIWQHRAWVLQGNRLCVLQKQGNIFFFFSFRMIGFHLLRLSNPTLLLLPTRPLKWSCINAALLSHLNCMSVTLFAQNSWDIWIFIFLFRDNGAGHGRVSHETLPNETLERFPDKTVYK